MIAIKTLLHAEQTETWSDDMLAEFPFLAEGGLTEPTGQGPCDIGLYGGRVMNTVSHDTTIRHFGPDNLYTLRLALSEADRLACWQLVYQEYLALGYTQTQEDPYRYSIHDALPEALTLLVERDGAVVGTVSGIPDTDLGLPADAIYSDELNAMRRSGHRLMEVGRLTIAREHMNDRQILTQLFDALTIYVRRIWKATDLVITVNPSHGRYYEGMLLFRRIGDDKALSSVCGAPAVLLALDMRLEERIRRFCTGEGPRPEEYTGGRLLYRYASNRQQENECVHRLTERFQKPELGFLRKYFVRKRPLLAELSEAGRRAFHAWYPDLGLAWPTEDSAAV